MIIATCRGAVRDVAKTRLMRPSDLQDLPVLLCERLVDAPDVAVGQMLDLLLQLALLVLRNFGVFLAPLEHLYTVAAHIADRDSRLLGIFCRYPRQLTPAFLIQFGDRNADRLTLGLRVEAQSGLP